MSPAALLLLISSPDVCYILSACSIQADKIHKEVDPYKLEVLIAGGAGGMKDKSEAFGFATRQSLNVVIPPNTHIQRAIKKVALEGNNSNVLGDDFALVN